MRTIISALVLAGTITAQSIGNSVPACAATCLNDGITSATSCSTTDAVCQCTVENYQAIYTAALTCVLNGCGVDTAIGEVLPAAEAFCLAAVGPFSAPPVDAKTAAASPTPASPVSTTTKTSTTPAAAPSPASSFGYGTFQTLVLKPTSA